MILSIFSLLLLVIWGFLLLNLFNITNLEKLGLSYLIGVGLFTLLLFILYTIGIRFTSINTIFVYLTSFLILFLINYKLGRIKKNNIYFNLSFKTTTEKVLVGILFFIFISVLISGFYRPISSWDSISLYDFRSRMFLQTGGFEAMSWWSYYFSYPPLTSLAQYWMYVFKAGTAMPIHACFYIFFVLSSFGVFKRWMNNILALIFTLFIALAPELFLHGHLAYTNLPYTLFLVLGTIYLYLFFKSHRYSDIILGAILIGLSTWSRTVEPFWIIPLTLTIIYSLINKKIFPIIIYCLIFFSIQLPWKQFQFSVAQVGSSNPVTTAVSTTSEMIKMHDTNAFKTVFDYLNWVIFDYYKVFLFIPLLLIVKKIIHKEKIDWFFPIFIICSLLILVGGTYVFSKTQPTWNQIPDSARRMMLFIPPVSIFYLAFTFKNKIK